ncbi:MULTISPECIES: hypothetical protein [Streptomyces]|uniref:hypothetical protein n=1 Tax=Streptomyces TaxID=1883 RepID=UPI0004C89C2D|nr:MULTISPECIES: hypothetical protein [unclassified Streptomyces]KJY21557.1 hypothetical protein VR43_10335 [Streptomyces sp. NRRL S-104]KOU83531.1 hypothetical protein ADK93_26775 [Streptomyces sp. XY58]KOV09370.1 hypothetical protein ADK89_07360 [Streptomyces sp. XY37]KOV51247.1 hypothetical protein ADK99_08560 [Streptomyces sp. MMG1064]
MSAAGPPDPADEPDSPHTGRRRQRWLAGSHRWQSLIAAVVTAVVAAVAAIVVAVISRQPSPTPSPTPNPQQTVAGGGTGTVVTTRLARQYEDPAATPAGVAVYFEGTVSGLDPDWTVIALVRRANERSGWPVALADVDRSRGTWKATVHVARPRFPLEMATGVVLMSAYGGDSAAPTSGTSKPQASPRPTGAATPQGLLEALRRDGPEAEGVEISSPFRPVPTAAP